jgi:hypothetical protein
MYLHLSPDAVENAAEVRAVDSLDFSALFSAISRYGMLSYVVDMHTPGDFVVTVTFNSYTAPQYFNTSHYTCTSPFSLPWSRILPDLAALVLLHSVSVVE